MRHAAKPLSPPPTEASNIAPAGDLPKWLPEAYRLYLDHTGEGQSLRALARARGVNPSTVLRAVRRCEELRDDPLVDAGLAALSRAQIVQKEPAMTPDLPNDQTIAAEAPRLLRRLSEEGAFLALAEGMDKAAVMRKLPDGRVMRMAVLDRALAQAFALNQWITCKSRGKITSYEITPAGRSEAKARAQARGMAEAQNAFLGEEAPRRIRYGAADSPVAVLARRLDKDGKPYLNAKLLHAAERLSEDFELAQMGPRVAQDWEQFLTGVDRARTRAEAEVARGPSAARARVAAGSSGPVKVWCRSFDHVMCSKGDEHGHRQNG